MNGWNAWRHHAMRGAIFTLFVGTIGCYLLGPYAVLWMAIGAVLTICGALLVRPRQDAPDSTRGLSGIRSLGRQYGLRAGLVILTGLCLLCGWYVNHFH